MLAEKEEAWHTLFAYVQVKIFLESVKSPSFYTIELCESLGIGNFYHSTRAQPCETNTNS